MTDEEAMALAVLKGDTDAARALADKLCEHIVQGEVRILPAIEVKDVNKVKVLVFLRADAEIDHTECTRTTQAIEGWILGRGSRTLIMTGVERVELYELP